MEDIRHIQPSSKGKLKQKYNRCLGKRKEVFLDPDYEEKEGEEEEPPYEEGSEADPTLLKHKEGAAHHAQSLDSSEVGDLVPESSDWRGLELDDINDDALLRWKHEAISEDRTIESNWDKKRLAVVLHQLSRPSLGQQKDPILAAG
ncbi:hypothetical protein TSTA_069460 [Talaromyces stipitatus ATCC 10500]|uniref:Uncharacterized protein n=1 Tax=Talaromyces stipitatus (strain ATCC 10500 / CBS 375.48 / QM 6759 / NRRL 1006) TaxID=441959 RepID=B8LT18_TALSN|nr:uncharacterized protein TSTA_069460 [Talaromyces stipitatus ATCC 10500]EED23526.1 hypothetical protein TSTA_069460 [Talaromyces stipitatus ATCC 10500]